jgi:hypothetical protein
MASNYWIKLYHEMLDDPKIGRLTDSQFRSMINLFLLAGDCEQDGYLPCVDDISWRLRHPPTLKDDLDALMRLDIIAEEDGALVICKFAERQGAMTPEERSQRRHERNRKLEYYRTESARNPHESGIDKDIEEKRIDKDIDKDVDKEKKQTSFSPTNFIGEFVTAVRVQFTNGDQSETIKDLVEDYGEDVVLQAATWYGTHHPRNMGHALASINGMLSRGWNVKDDKPNNESVFKEYLNGNKRNGDNTDTEIEPAPSAVQAHAGNAG